MSRIAKNPVVIPAGVEVKFGTDVLTIKGKNGELSLPLSQDVNVALEDGQLTFAAANASKQSNAMSGTFRALVNNMVKGVTEGFERRLQLIGVGYKAAVAGNKVNLNLGYSHSIEYVLPEGVTAETPTATEIVLKSSDKQKLGQAAANIRGYRPPEPYKGKGVRYSDEYVARKEAKKK